MSRGTNETSVFSGTFSDTNDHYLPDTTAADTEGYDVRTKERTSVVVTNDQDQDATVDLEGSAFNDKGMADAGSLLGSTVTVAAGSTEIVSVPIEAAPAFLRLKVSFATAPTGNNPITATYQSDESG
jgi:hypothetical protein